MGAKTQRRRQTAKKHHSMGFWNGVMKQKRLAPKIKTESVLPPGCSSGIGDHSWAFIIRWVEEQRKKDVSASSSLRVRVPAFKFLYELEIK